MAVEEEVKQRKPKSKLAERALALDAWLDTTVYNLGFRLSDWWENVTIFSRRFRVRGWRRWFAEIGSEGMTLLAGGVILMLFLARPAFEETKKDWRNQGQFAVTFQDRYGNEIGRRGVIQRDSVPVDEMPDYVIKAVLATEDRRFFEHWGIDPIGLARAMSVNVQSNSVVQGGSTLTQQLAKNTFLTNERRFERKIKEAFLSVWLEQNLSKKEILQLYLDNVYMGGGTFGITAAADFYFGKQVKDLSLAEAAMLAGLFKAPTKYAPHINLPSARGRANEVLTNLVQSGFMTEGQVLAARLHPANVVDRGEIESPDYFLDWAFEEAKRLAQPYGIHSMVARTTIDMGVQKAAEEALEFNLRQYGKDFKVDEGAIVVLETTGAVRAVVGGRDYGESQFNRATRALRQVGSSFKPFVYAAAMEIGMKPEDVVSDGPISWGEWSPQNYGRGFSGRVTLANALARSINTVPVRLAKDRLGIPKVMEMTHALGVESKLNGHKTMVLGTSELTPLDMATAYNTFADGGIAGVRHGISQLRTRAGEVFWDASSDMAPPRRVLSEEAVGNMNTMMALVPEAGTGRRAALSYVRSGGKTGTTQSYRDAWYVGYTGNFTAAVWLGNDDFSTTNDMTGGTLPSMTWRRLMTAIHRNIELKPIPGLKNPLYSAEFVAKARAGENAGSGDAPPLQSSTPSALSGETTRMLRGLVDRFSATQPLAEPAAMTSL